MDLGNILPGFIVAIVGRNMLLILLEF